MGCGLLMNPENKLSIFFTGNGILMGQSLLWLIKLIILYKITKFTGKPIPIDSTLDLLYPSLSLPENILLEANFGDDSAKSFSYDIDKCPVMNLEWNLDKKSTLRIYE
jgi:hypothetical protein